MSVSNKFVTLRDNCLMKKQLYCDPDFEHFNTFRSGDGDDVEYQEVKWLRPHEISDDPKFNVQELTKDDVIQGSNFPGFFNRVNRVNH